MLSFNHYVELYKPEGFYANDLGGCSTITLKLNAGETAVYYVRDCYDYGPATTSFSYIGRVEKLDGYSDYYYSITLDKGEVVYVDLSKLYEYDYWDDGYRIYPFEINAGSRQSIVAVLTSD